MRSLALIAALPALAACSGSDAESDVTSYEQEAAQPVAEINAQPLLPWQGDLRLTPLAETAGTAFGSTRGGCTFAYQGRTLLAAGAPDTAPGQVKAVLVADGRQLVLTDADAKNAKALEAGAVLADGAWSAQVVRAEGSPEPVAAGNLWAADLYVEGPDGEARFSPGTWTCSR